MRKEVGHVMSCVTRVERVTHYIGFYASEMPHGGTPARCIAEALAKVPPDAHLVDVEYPDDDDVGAYQFFRLAFRAEVPTPDSTNALQGGEG